MSDTTPATIDLQGLRRSLNGDAVLPGDETWDSARQAWNLAVDQHPAAVAHAADAEDVARVIDFARQHGLRVAVQATGHGAGAMGPLEDAILLKTDRMTGVEIDVGARVARVASRSTPPPAAPASRPGRCRRRSRSAPARPGWPPCSAPRPTRASSASRSEAAPAGSGAATA